MHNLLLYKGYKVCTSLFTVPTFLVGTVIGVFCISKSVINLHLFSMIAEGFSGYDIRSWWYPRGVEFIKQTCFNLGAYGLFHFDGSLQDYVDNLRLKFCYINPTRFGQILVLTSYPEKPLSILVHSDDHW